jgi:alpha-1,3-rhamnosyl/mannosyltransferase
LQRHGLAQGRYILCVGTREPRKNLATAVAAYAGLPGPLRDQLPLVLIGARGWGDEDWAKRHQPLVSAGQVRLLGYVPRLELRDILSGAGLVAYPSLYEGFGMPVAEASACGAPVAISDCPALGEAAGVGQGVSVCEGVSVTAARDVDGWRAVFAAVAEGPPRLAPIPARRDAAERFRAHVQAERALRVLSIAAIATGGGNG